MNSTLKKEALISIISHSLSILCGVLLAHSFLNAGTAASITADIPALSAEIAGLIITGLGPILYSYWRKLVDHAKMAVAAASPTTTLAANVSATVDAMTVKETSAVANGTAPAPIAVVPPALPVIPPAVPKP